MKTIKERAEASVTFLKVGGDMADNDVFIHNIQAEGKREGYIKGATEQKAIDMEKACEWLETYMEGLGYIDEWCRKGEDDFKKAMEE